MRLDERAAEATQTLRAVVDRDVQPAPMLASLRRTRNRRRAALVALPLALALLGGALWSGTRPEHPAVVSRPPVVVHANGFLLGTGNPELTHADGLHLPPISDGSSPTWSPDGRELAVLADGILVTDVSTGTQHRLPCPGCAEIAWSPDGSQFAAVTGTRDGISLVDATSGVMSEDRTRGVERIHSLTWSPDGRELAFVADDRGGNGRSRQAVFVGDLDSGVRTVAFAGPAYDGIGSFHRADVLAVSWRPAGDDELAILLAFSGARNEPSPLRVLTLHSDGSGVTTLDRDGTCFCVGWAPNVEWSPDGTTIAVYAQREHSASTLDGDGSSLRLRYVKGSGPLAWQPR